MKSRHAYAGSPHTGRVTALLTLLCLTAAACAVGVEPDRQAMDDAWWTGPLLAASPGPFAQGHALIEPYVFDAIRQARYDPDGRRHGVPHENDFGSQSYLLYGFTDSISGGLIPRFAYDSWGPRGGSTNLRVGDLGLQGQYGLTKFREGSWVPTSAVVLGETLPTGRYDRLGAHPANGAGAGVYTTSVALYSQYLFWLPTGRILRTRLDLTYSISGATDIHDASVYGTNAGFSGHARPGNSFVADAAWEYSLTHNWVLALDVAFEHDANTHVTGINLSDLSMRPLEMNSGAAHSLSVAPAVEYNFNNRVGVIAGAKVTAAGRNTAQVITPVAAINIVI